MKSRAILDTCAEQQYWVYDEQLAMRKEDWKKLKITKTEFYAYYWVKFVSIYIVLNFELIFIKNAPCSSTAA